MVLQDRTLLYNMPDTGRPSTGLRRFWVGVYTGYSPVHCILQEQGTSKGLQRQLLAEEFFNTLYKALHKKSLHLFFSCSLLRLTGCLRLALANTTLWLWFLNFSFYIQD